MPDTKVPVADVPRVLDHEAFGRAVLQWALMSPDDRPKTVDQLKAWFPAPDKVIAFPAHVAPDHHVSMFQGTPDTMVINLPPLHKLLPMLAYLGEDVETFVQPSSLGFDPAVPPIVPTKEGEQHYRIPDFFFEYVDDVRGGDGMTDKEFTDFFLKVVGFYSYAGCR